MKDVLPPAPGADRDDERPAPAATSGRPQPRLGDAMAALLRTADVKVQRGDETRVLSRPQQALADIERRKPGSLNSRTPLFDPSRPISSGPPRPRVDTALWIVLAVGLFAIAGWMLAYSL